MIRSIIKREDLAPPEPLNQLFADPPLVGNEKREDYDRLFSDVAGALKPADSIVWIFVKDFVDLSWDIIRERKIKAHIIRSHEIVAVRDALKAIGSDGHFSNADVEAREWATDPKSRLKHGKKLSNNGFTATELLAHAYIDGGPAIDAIDRRIASYELRRMAVLRTIQNHSEKLARQVFEAVSSEVLEGDFTEAVEIK